MNRGILPLALLALGAVGARAESILIRRDTLVPIIFNTTIDADRARVGDRFTARVDGTRELPRGTRLSGRIDRIEGRRNDHNRTLRLHFDEARLPDGSRVRIDATPVALDRDYGHRAPDGRVEGRRNDRAKETKVLGGLLGGLVLGSIIHKPVEGAILGTIVGGVAAESNREDGRPIAIRDGQRYGMLFNRDVRFEYDRSARDGNDPYDRLRDRDPNRDDRRDDSRRDNRSDDASRNDESRNDDRYATDDFRLFRGRDELRYDRVQPIRRDREVLVPLEETARLLGVDIREGTRGATYLETDRGLVKLRVDDRRILRDGQEANLAVAPTKIDDRVYVPLEVFRTLVKESLRIDGR